MSNNGRGVKFWLRAWLPVVLAAGLVAIESTPYFGSDRTSGPLRHIWEWLFGPISNRHWHYIHLAIRKSGHFAGFGLIGLSWLRAWWITMPRSRFFTDAALALFGTALIASCDEWHQASLPNRTGTPWDVLLDCTGAAALMLLAYLFMRMKKPRRLARAA
jgi:VanZ family protein